MKKLHELVSAYPGKSRLTLRIQTGKSLPPIKRFDIDISETISVAPSEELISELQNLFGEKALTFELHKNNHIVLDL